MSLACCRADLALDVGCAGHLGTALYWCPEHASHACVCIVALAAAGIPATALPARAEPPLRITATHVYAAPSCLVLWHGEGWVGRVPMLIVETVARRSIASSVRRLVYCGLN